MIHLAQRAARRIKISRSLSTASEMVRTAGGGIIAGPASVNGVSVGLLAFRSGTKIRHLANGPIHRD
jgi:predicted aspartyl protease